MKKQMKMLTLALVMVLVLTLAACASRNTYSAAKLLDSPAAPSSGEENIGLDKAKEIAFANAGVSEAQAADKDYDLENGVYEIDFDYGNLEYEYKIQANTGEILSARREEDPGNTTAEGADYIGLDKAKEIAYAHAGVTEAQATDKDYDLENGVYEIDFDHGNLEYEYHIHATTGEILKSHHKEDHHDDYHDDDHHDDDHHDDDHHDGRPQDTTGYIGLEKAKAIAYQNAGVSEAQATDKDYDLENGVYEIDFTYGGMEYEYKINAKTGEILKSRKEADD